MAKIGVIPAQSNLVRLVIIAATAMRKQEYIPQAVNPPNCDALRLSASAVHVPKLSSIGAQTEQFGDTGLKQALGDKILR